MSDARLSGLCQPFRHPNVLQYLMGSLKNHLACEDKQELLGVTEDYRQGLLPLISCR
jgi:uncharacterized protein YbgA (DUF1722 family)